MNGLGFGRVAAIEISHGGDSMISNGSAPGAYVLHLALEASLRVRIRTLGEHVLSPGRYFYVGSARRGMAARCRRHERLSRMKQGKAHWHIDALLTARRCRLIRIETFPGADECAVSRQLARRENIVAPIPGFGATDCRSGCPAHLYLASNLKPAASRR